MQRWANLPEVMNGEVNGGVSLHSKWSQLTLLHPVSKQLPQRIANALHPPSSLMAKHGEPSRLQAPCWDDTSLHFQPLASRTSLLIRIVVPGDWNVHLSACLIDRNPAPPALGEDRLCHQRVCHVRNSGSTYSKLSINRRMNCQLLEALPTFSERLKERRLE